MVQTHYFTDNRSLPSDEKKIRFSFGGHEYIFITDEGVFSKSSVDKGTEILLKNAVKLPVGLSIADVGCGYGVIGIVMRSLYPRSSVICGDVNQRALALAERNAELNHVEINTVFSDCMSGMHGMYDLVLTNPPIRAGKETVYGIFADAYAHMNEDGILLAVVRRKQGAESAERKIREIFGNCEVADREKGYWILKGVRN